MQRAEHDRWQEGIGPFEEERQIEMLREAIEGNVPYSIDTEVSYLDGGQRADLFIESEETSIPIEAKLLRFRYDNGNIDPNSFAKVFTPFPEHSTSTLFTDARKLYEAGFENNGGLLGLYYAPVDESYDAMTPAAIAEKFCLDVDYWYDFEVETRNVAHFDGLRHPGAARGCVVIGRSPPLLADLGAVVQPENGGVRDRLDHAGVVFVASSLTRINHGDIKKSE